MADEEDETSFNRPRILIAGAFTTILSLLLLLDAVSKDYQVSEGGLVVILGAILYLLGIEAADIIRGGK